jgi:hypothetical protein
MMENIVLVNSERLLIRTPEVVLGVLNHVFKAFELDLSKLFCEKFADSLLSKLSKHFNT